MICRPFINRQTRHHRRYPRRHRRGLAALTATLFVAALLLSLSSLWIVAEARQKIAGEAALVAEAVAWAGYGLHHWLHENRSNVTDCDGKRIFVGEPLSSDCDILAYGGPAPWAVPPRNWAIVLHIRTPGGQEWNDPLPHGILVVRPLDCTADRDRARFLHSEVAQRLGVAVDETTAPAGRPPAAGPALALVGSQARDCDLVVFAHSFSRIDPSLVLREPRAGFSPPVMETALDMDGNSITGDGTLTIGTLTGEELGVAADGSTPPAPGTIKANYGAINNITVGRNCDPNADPNCDAKPDLVVRKRFFCGTGCGETP